LKSILPIWVTMKFTTALSFALSGILFLTITRFLNNKHEFSRSLIILPAITIIFFMMFTLFSNLLNFESSIVAIFTLDDAGTHSLNKGIPSFGTMLNFLLIGVSGLLFMLNPALISKLLRPLGSIITVIGVIAITGYMISQPVLYYQIEFFSGAMAFHTAILFVVCGTGILVYSFEKTNISIQSLTKQEYVWLGYFTIGISIFVFLLHISKHTSLQYHDFFNELQFLFLFISILSIIIIFQRIIFTHNNLDNTIKQSVAVIEKQLKELRIVETKKK